MGDRDVEGEGRPEEDVGTDGAYVMRIDYIIYSVYDIGRSVFRNSLGCAGSSQSFDRCNSHNIQEKKDRGGGVVELRCSIGVCENWLFMLILRKEDIVICGAVVARIVFWLIDFAVGKKWPFNVLVWVIAQKCS